MMAVYRGNFNAIDRLNKETFGRSSVCEAIGTRTWWKRFWFALLSMSVANAYHAYCDPWRKEAIMDRFEFVDRLADGLLNNKYAVAEEAGPAYQITTAHSYQVYQ